MVRDRALDFAACASAAVGGFSSGLNRQAVVHTTVILGVARCAGTSHGDVRSSAPGRHLAAGPAAVAAPQRDSIPKTYPNGQVVAALCPSRLI